MKQMQAGRWKAQ